MTACTKVAVRHYAFPRGWWGYVLARSGFFSLYLLLGGATAYVLLTPGAGAIRFCLLFWTFSLPLHLATALEMIEYRAHRRFHGPARLVVGTTALTYGCGPTARRIEKAEVLCVVDYQMLQSSGAPFRTLGYAELWLQSGAVLCLSSELIPTSELVAALPHAAWENRTTWKLRLPEWADQQGFGC